MNLMGDYVALGITAILCGFNFIGNHIRTKASKHFSFCLVFTVLTAISNIVFHMLYGYAEVSPFILIALKTFYYTVNIIAMTLIAMVFVLKIVEHTYGKRDITRARITFAMVFAVYFVLLCISIIKGTIVFEEHGVGHIRGQLSYVGYIAIVAMIMVVTVCYFKNRRNATKAVKAAIIHTYIITAFCVFFHQVFLDVHLNSLMLSLIDLVVFLNFRNNRLGIHTLTNLNDRHSLFSFLESSTEADKKYTAYIICIKNFDIVAAKYGHKTGDEIIYRFAFALEKLIDESNTFYLEDMCFVVLVPEKGSGSTVTQKITKFVEKAIEINGESINLDCIVVEKNDFSDKSEYKNANVIYEEFKYAVDYAKVIGEKYFVFTPEMSEHILRRKYIIGRLKNVDAEHGFEVYFQPVHCRASDKFCSMEALMRLKEKDGTFISPAEFIPIAEQTGMISAITWFAVEQSCRAISEHPELKDVNVSVNFPMEQLYHSDFLPTLNEITSKYGINHDQLCLEFTERVMMDDFSRAKENMEKITSHGYRFFLDDFGTGFSNFSCILQLPFDTVKIDSSLTLVDKNNKNERNIVSSLTELFHSMGLKVVAEGVETEQEVNVLSGMKIDRLQGYYFSRPVPVNEVVEFYKKNPINQ